VQTFTDKVPPIQDVRAFIGSRDFDLSRDFYIALGWQMTYDSESIRVMSLGSKHFYLQKYYHKEWCENTMLHISVPDVDEWYAFASESFTTHQLHEHGRISDEPKDEGYGRVFHIWDPAGVLLHVAQFYD